MIKTGAIIVTRKPDLQILRRSVKRLLAQVDNLFIVDNGSGGRFPDCFHNAKTDCILLGDNLGIAAALNIGIERAHEAGCRYILLLDQDSTPPPGMVARFHEVNAFLTSTGIRVAGIGPRHRDRRTGHISRFVTFNWFHFRTRGGREKAPIVPADFLISSGSFYDISVFERVGLFNDGFFIDHVDTEWFHRARSLGYHAFGVWDVVMPHSLGERSIPIWFFRKRIQPIHRPFRLYYVLRNSLLMYRMAHSSSRWITGDVMRLVRLIIIYAFFVPNRRASIAYMGRGLHDGIRGITGPYKRTGLD